MACWGIDTSLRELGQQNQRAVMAPPGVSLLEKSGCWWVWTPSFRPERASFHNSIRSNSSSTLKVKAGRGISKGQWQQASCSAGEERRGGWMEGIYVSNLHVLQKYHFKERQVYFRHVNQIKAEGVVVLSVVTHCKYVASSNGLSSFPETGGERERRKRQTWSSW